MESKAEKESSSRSSTEERAGERWLRLGRVGRPHGTGGAFHVSDPTARLELLNAGRSVRVGSVERTVVSRRGTDARPVIEVTGVQDRQEAGALTGQPITVSREQLGELAAGEYLVDDLVSCEVRTGKRRLGRVSDVLLLPSVDAIEVEDENGDKLIVPLVSAAIERVDLEARTIEVDGGFLGV